MSESALDLLKRMLTVQPTLRISVREISTHPWVFDAASPPAAHPHSTTVRITVRASHLNMFTFALTFTHIYICIDSSTCATLCNSLGRVSFGFLNFFTVELMLLPQNNAR